MKKFLLTSLFSITSLYSSAPEKTPAQTDLKASGEWIRPAMVVDRPYIQDFRHAVRRVISENRLEKLKRCQKSLKAEASRVARLNRSMLLLARSSGETIQAERKMREAHAAELRMTQPKYRGLKNSSAALLQSAQRAQAHLETELFSARHAYECLTARAQSEDQEHRLQIERLQSEMLAAGEQITREREECKRTAESLGAEVSAARGAQSSAQQQFQTTFEELNRLRGEHQGLEQRLVHVQTEHASSEQKLRAELTTTVANAQQNYGALYNELNTYKRHYATAQQQLQQAQTEHASSEQKLLAETRSQTERAAAIEQQLRAELRDLNSNYSSLGQNLRGQLTAAQQQLQQERATRVAVEEQLRSRETAIGVTERYIIGLHNTHRAEKEDLNQRLRDAEAARARYKALKDFIITQYDAHYKVAIKGNADHAYLKLCNALHLLASGTCMSNKVQRKQLGDKANFTALLNSHFAS